MLLVLIIFHPYLQSLLMGSFLSKTQLESENSGTRLHSSGGYKLHKHGRPRTSGFRIFFEKDGVPLSPFHDIPLYADEEKYIFNMVVEIPRWTNAKYEVSPTLVIELKSSFYPGVDIAIRRAQSDPSGR